MSNIIDNKKFFNFRTKDEMSFLKRIVWQLFPKSSNFGHLFEKGDL